MGGLGMMNFIWVGLVVISILASMVNGTVPEMQDAIFTSAEAAVTLVIGLTGMMAFWMGIMRVAQESGLTEKLGRFLRPVMKRLFPDVPPDHPAMSAMMMNIAANMLGLGNAATPFGLTAMKELQTLNPTKTVATDAMVMFLALNTSSMTLIPTTILALRSAAGSQNPTSVIAPILLTTAISTIVAICGAKGLSRLRMWRFNYIAQCE